VTVATAAKRRALATAPEPLEPRRKWRIITVATLLLVPAYWMVLAGAVASVSDDAQAPNAGGALAVGLAVIPFVFLVLAVMSGQRNPGSTVLKAMGLSLLVGLPVSALAGDAVTGIVAAVGAGGIVALRADEDHTWRSRAVAVTIAALYTLLLVHTVAVLALLPAPVLPLTAIGIADHVAERRAERDRGESG
jgi:hypothetical protein